MRTPGFAILLLTACLGTTTAQAVCTTGVECIRERFGTDPITRTNRIIDRTTGYSDRNRPVHPYVARQGLRTAPGNRTIYAPTGPQAALDGLQPNQLRRDPRLAPGATSGTTVNPYLANPYAPGATAPGATGPDVGTAPGLTPQPYAPAAPSTGPAGQVGGTSPYATAAGRPAQPTARDPNRPVSAADAFSGGLQSPGADR